jgi:hypothetical protein
VVWSYFNNRVGDGEARYAMSSIWRAIFRDIGATVPP